MDTADALPAVDLAFAVAVPARDEERRIERCLGALSIAADRAGSDVVIAVACDSCTDATAAVARSVAAQDPRIAVIEGRWGRAGGARRAAAMHALRRLGDLSGLPETWLLSTDADTVVPATWIAEIATLSADGADAVAGIVDLLHDEDWDPAVASAFAANYPIDLSHRHVHAANLAVRANVYTAVGGFADIPVGEDHDLWRRLHERGHRRVASLGWRVETSARRQGRAPGGFADTLAGHLASRPRNGAVA